MICDKSTVEDFIEAILHRAYDDYCHDFDLGELVQRAMPKVQQILKCDDRPEAEEVFEERNANLHDALSKFLEAEGFDTKDLDHYFKR
jgi:hypothetical protein